MTTRRWSLLLAALLAGGCGDGEVAWSDAEEVIAGRDADMEVSADAAAVGYRQAPSQPAPRMLIRTGRAELEVEELDPAVEAVRLLAERAGGFISNVGVQSGRDRTRMATLTLRVPADRFDEVVAALDTIGEQESVHIDSEDVGEAYADLEIRVANARRLEQRLLELLATRTGSLEDVLAVERELARVRQEIELIDAQIRSLRNRVDLSTLTVTLHEPEPIFSTGPGENVLARSFRQAGRNFTGFVAGLIASLGVVIPLVVLVLLLWWAWRGLRRRRRARYDSID